MKQVNLYLNLTVAGTYHSLTEEDKIGIDSLINNADFVGIEWDHLRKTPGWKEKYIHRRLFGRTKLVGDELYVNLMSDYFIKKITNWTREHINQVAQDRKATRNDKKYLNEFSYIRDKCESVEKPCYLVDIPITHTLYQEWINLWHVYDLFSTEWDTFNVKGRNEYMIQKLNEKTRFLSNHSIKGVLFVGIGHLHSFLCEEIQKM